MVAHVALSLSRLVLTWLRLEVTGLKWLSGFIHAAETEYVV